MFQLYSSDLDQQLLTTQLQVLHCNIPKEYVHGTEIKGITDYLRSLSSCERQLYSMVIKLIQLVVVVPATNAVSERFFSAKVLKDLA